MTTLAPTPAGDRHSQADDVTADRADCQADSAGGLTFDIGDPGTPGPAHLVLRRRDSGHPAEEVRLPLTPAADGRLRAALPSSVRLAEGRWDVHVQHAGEESHRLAPGVNDLRSLVDRVPDGTGEQIAVRIPYATKHGNLTVRSWLRSPHAEAGEILISEASIDIRGRVYGTPLTPDAYAEAVSRTEPHRVQRSRVTVDGADFTVILHYGLLADAGPGRWNLWLRPAGESGPRVRIARLLDDVPDKKAIFTYPFVRSETRHGTVETGPYYTLDNDLSVHVRAAGPGKDS
ncbi:FixH family protein [Streptomyces jeddahensis]|uniref:Transferase n=1 Tax=Streptomyces jeddahensis TaxID=1716141 RepID=A0A177I140_9ACTN|nr:FixH family protein [Streptomyces jeddahensis]OAH16539.1 hypothetical protein STSP_00820 [Streptomyces jeddahensis]